MIKNFKDINRNIGILHNIKDRIEEEDCLKVGQEEQDCLKDGQEKQDCLRDRQKQDCLRDEQKKKNYLRNRQEKQDCLRDRQKQDCLRDRQEKQYCLRDGEEEQNSAHIDVRIKVFELSNCVQRSGLRLNVPVTVERHVEVGGRLVLSRRPS